jgi:cation-transporting ATPase 13A1
MQLKEKFLSARMKAEFEERKKVLLAQQQALLQLELAKPNNGGYWACIKKVTLEMRTQLNEEGKKLQAKYGLQAAWASNDQSPSQSPSSAVQMGDASVAAPFTSRAPSIRSVVQIIKQGRCTLLVAVQMMQIMMLESLISAYTFAAITMEGGRSTELQMIASSVFVMIASVAFTYAKPAKKLSAVIPLKSVFHPAIFVSVLCQVLLHIAVLVHAMSWAKTEMGESALSDLYAFERSREAKLASMMTASSQQPESSSWFPSSPEGMWSMFKSVPYQPNLLNTVMFLVKTSQQVSVLVVNYKGSPWMQGALENKALFLSMFACALGIVLCSTGYIPLLNSTLELLVLPSEFRNKLLLLLAASSFGTLLLDRVIVMIFAPAIFAASTWNPLRATKISDFLPLIKTCGYVLLAAVAAPLLLGNPIGLIGAFFLFRQYRTYTSEREQAELKERFPALFQEQEKKRD